MGLVETLEFQNTQRTVLASQRKIRGCLITEELLQGVPKKITGSTDLSFGMQGSLIGLVETLQFQNTQRSEDSFSFLAQN